jgi:hypothetical protein
MKMSERCVVTCTGHLRRLEITGHQSDVPVQHFRPHGRRLGKSPLAMLTAWASLLKQSIGPVIIRPIRPYIAVIELQIGA